MKAPSVQEMERIKKNYEYTKQQKALCFQKLKKNQIPAVCYQLKRKDALYHNYLDEKCLNTSLKSITLNQISEALKTPHVSFRCLNFIKEKKKILKYQNQDLTKDVILNRQVSL